MSWQTDDGKHEMWIAAEFPGGWFSVGSTADGAMVERPGPDGRFHTAGDAGVLDGRQAIGWRGVCECGWRGSLWQRVDDPAAHDPAEYRIYDPDPSRHGDAPQEVEDAVWREWKDQDLEPETIADVRRAADDVRAAQARLDAAVRAARRDGRSWADIGTAAGISRQSAHERWARSDLANDVAQ
ncbi:hypothetical protein NE236_42050 [Actinoallomurus purpureus]|uniref:hypothetical protein n=1 Tax=Actinoallomurus purpureus TaxID=478114 RepID=UPI0020938729|nr:hypothetical protein [Actinoallomurus purpureus]MCO6011555.1 hypothetical protein [Actinoallomurus purpureus]